MLYVKNVKNDAGEFTPITYGNTFAKCPHCGVMHQIDLADILECAGGDVEGTSAYCEKCSAKHMPMFENGDRLQAIADRFGVHLGEVQKIVRSGIDRGLSFEACLTGARLILSMKTGKHELFSLCDAAAALGCTEKEVTAELKELGVEPMKLTTLPGFEWLLG